MKSIWGTFIRTCRNEEYVSDTDKARRAAEKATNPATVCECGTVRTPGTQHIKGDTGPTPKPLGSAWCSK